MKNHGSVAWIISCRVRLIYFPAVIISLMCWIRFWGDGEHGKRSLYGLFTHLANWLRFSFSCKWAWLLYGWHTTYALYIMLHFHTNFVAYLLYITTIVMNTSNVALHAIILCSVHYPPYYIVMLVLFSLWSSKLLACTLLYYVQHLNAAATKCGEII